MPTETTFTRFDTLAAVLAELSFDVVTLTFHRYSTGTDGFVVSLHPMCGECYSGHGDTASEALINALDRVSQKEAAKVEAKAAELVA